MDEEQILGEKSAAEIEATYVHTVYDEIADHFSLTRQRAWPMVQSFLAQYPGELVADVGCGNGKYPFLCKENYFIANDRSEKLLEICVERKLHVFQCDILSLPLRRNSFDRVICIAVLHHISTEERRLQAISQLMAIARYGGSVYITVWGRVNERSARNADSLISWTTPAKSGNRTVLRYYHLFEDGELERLATAAGYTDFTSCYDRGNYAIEIFKREARGQSPAGQT